MTATTVRGLGAAVGVVTMLAAGASSGGWWWAAAGVGAFAAAGSVADRHLAHAHVVATLALAVGLAAESSVWMVPVLVAGTIGAIELGAAADRTTVVRPVVPDLQRSLLTIPAAGVVSGSVLLAAQVPTIAFSGAVVVAALAGVIATRVIAR